MSTECAPERFTDFLRHELRWAITVRHSRPTAYLGRVVLTQGLPWSIVVAALGPPAIAVGYTMLYVTLRLAVAWTVAVRGLRDETLVRREWLVLAHDAVALMISLAAWCSNRIEWRGRWFDLHHGRLVPVPITSRSGRELP